MLSDPAVLTTVVDHLTVGDLFRLSRAIGPTALTSWPPEVAPVVATRMRLLVKHGWTMEQLGTRMATTRRCVECGIPTRRNPRVCIDCEGDPRCPVAMSTRADVLHRYHRHPIRGLRRAALQELQPIKRSRHGRIYYWRRDVDDLFQRWGGAM